jgi:hypothetical protein
LYLKKLGGEMPFSTDDFLGVFKSYNNALFPFQVILFLSAVYIVFLVFKGKSSRDHVINLILVFYWFWMGIVYHIIFFSSINPAAFLFGALFIVQGILLIKAGIADKKLEYAPPQGLYLYTGVVIILYALILYPLLGIYFGHLYPKSPTFGLPCPTTIFTFGIFLLAAKKIPSYILIIPLLWAVIGFSAVINFGIKEDTGLIIAGIIASWLILREKLSGRKIKTA